MPLLPIPDGTTKIEVIYDVSGLNAVNVLWFDGPTLGVDQAKLDALVLGFSVEWGTHIMPRMWSNVVVQEYRGSYYDGGLGEVQLQSLLPSSAAGTVVAEEPCPPNVAVVLSWRTAVGGRQNRGRSYLPGVPVQWVQDSGQLVPAERLAYQSAGNAFITDVNAVDADFVFSVFSRPTWDPPRAADPPRPADPNPARPGHMTPITSCFVDTTVDTQRGRLRN